MSSTLTGILLVLFGVPVGSFTNVVIYRLRVRAERRNLSIEDELAAEEHEKAVEAATVAGEPAPAPPAPIERPERPWEDDLRISTGRSLCPQCGTQIEAKDNIPILSYALLRGRCRSCAARIPAHYPVVELAVPLLWLSLLASLGNGWHLVPFLWLVPILVAATVIDFQVFLIPKELIWVGWPVSVALIWLASAQAFPEASFRQTVGEALLGSLFFGGLFFLAWLVYPRGMGFGDVRLATLLGLFLGWIDLYLVLPAMILACLIALPGGTKPVVRLVLPSEVSKPFGKRRVPFGPWLVVGALCCFWFTATILDVVKPSV